MSWTDDRINLLKKMWKEGKSAADIAKILGKNVTRNAVIGKAHRLGLSNRPSPIKEDKPGAKKAAAPAPKKEKGDNKAEKFAKELKLLKTPPKEAKKPSGPLAAPSKGGAKNALPHKEAEELKRIEKEVIPPGGGVALIDLTERMCKWPIGDPREADFTFCGQPIRAGTPYCPGHAATAYQTSSRKGQQAAAVANEDKEDVAVESEESDEVEEEEETVA